MLVIVFDIGLVSMRQHPFIGVSADGIVHGKSPCGETFLAPLEIKTKVAQRAIDDARKVEQRHGKYFECAAGDEVWFDAVPYEYAGQVVHQAVVFQLNHVLFVVATVRGEIYRVLVHINQEQRQLYLTSLLRFKHLVSWAHTGGEVSDCVDGIA